MTPLLADTMQRQTLEHAKNVRSPFFHEDRRAWNKIHGGKPLILINTAVSVVERCSCIEEDLIANSIYRQNLFPEFCLGSALCANK